MLFSSYEFILAFFPVVLIVYSLLKRTNPAYGIYWLTLSSLFFYSWWNPKYLLLLFVSIIVNYSIGRLIITSATDSKKKAYMYMGVFFNLCALGYFKYTHFILNSLGEVFSYSHSIEAIVLPLAISFFSFQQIAYIVDLRRGVEADYSFVEYVLFVSFFPQLIAGPIVHHKEMMPQFTRKDFSENIPKISYGLSLFIIGLFKKVVIADSLAVFANPLFSASKNTLNISFVESWLGSLSYTFQLYFDFSGYSDMAIGLAACFGIIIPMNFNSPYKSLNIVDFWRRWHITLSRFLRDYLYISMGGNRKGLSRRYINLMLTMILGGLWHGASWLFVIWGTLHGLYLVVNHLWSQFIGYRWAEKISYKLVSQAMTFIFVVFAWVVFRAENLTSATQILKSMTGFNGISLPSQYLRFAPGLESHISFEVMNYFFGVESIIWIFAAAVIAFTFPNSQQIMDHTAKLKSNFSKKIFLWKESHYWVATMAIMSLMSFYYLNRVSDFLYFQF